MIHLFKIHKISAKPFLTFSTFTIPSTLGNCIQNYLRKCICISRNCQYCIWTTEQNEMKMPNLDQQLLRAYYIICRKVDIHEGNKNIILLHFVLISLAMAILTATFFCGLLIHLNVPGHIHSCIRIYESEEYAQRPQNCMQYSPIS